MNAVCVNELMIENKLLEKELSQLRMRIGMLEREKIEIETERKKYKNFKFIGKTKETFVDNLFDAVINLRTTYHNIIEYINIAGMSTSDYLSLFDTEVIEKITTNTDIDEMMKKLQTSSKILAKFSEWTVKNIPIRIMNLETTKTTAFTVIDRRETSEILSLIKREGIGDKTWNEEVQKMNISQETKSEILDKIPKLLKKAREVSLTKRIKWIKWLKHDDLSIDKQRKRYIFSKYVDKSTISMKIKFELVPTFSAYKILCRQWESYLKRKNISVKTCWDDHDIFKNKNEKLLGLT